MSWAQGLELSVGKDQVLKAWPCARRSKTRGGPLCRGTSCAPSCPNPSAPLCPGAAPTAPAWPPRGFLVLERGQLGATWLKLWPARPLPAGWVVTVDEAQVLHVTRAEHAVDLPRDGGGGLFLVLLLLSTLLL